MADVVSSNSPSLTKLEEKISSLEAKIAALEKRHNDLHEKASTLTENPAGKSSEVAATEPAPTDSTADKDKEKGTEIKSRANILINRTDPQSGERKDQPPDDASPTTSDATGKSQAFTLRKFLYDSPDDNDGELDITFPPLWELLKDLLCHYPGHTFQGSPITLYSPYEPLILYWEKLEQASNEEPKDSKEDKQARSDLRLLLDTIASASGDPKLDKYFKNRDSNKEQKIVTFETLWTLFPPGELVYGKPFQGEHQLFIVQDNMRVWPHSQSGQREQPPWSLLCWTYDWNGKKFLRTSIVLEFESFDGQKPITSLPYYPFELNENRADIKPLLYKRGEMYRRFCSAQPGSRMFEYSGEAIFVEKGFSGIRGDDDKDEDGISRSILDPDMEFLRRLRSSSSGSSGPPAKSTKIESRVMVDFESYFRYGPSIARVGSLVPSSDNIECGCLNCRENKVLQEGYRTRFDEEKNQKDSWEEEQYMLCPPRVLGYILREKQWAQLQVTFLQDIPKHDPNNSWASRLKLADGEKTKDMILNLVLGHGTSDSVQNDGLEVDDIIARKGKGLVILLYGPPGVGKTSTAETVAIAARKPLFAISVADVGTKAKNVEANLAKIFSLATSWQAILLIDEADVFLESRAGGVASNTERNALVSVFLRVLEYYQGILMLTTNQIAQFDVAVHSRIHVAIKYDQLNAEQTKSIFEGFLKPLAERGLVKDIQGITEWLEEDVIKKGLDGRQIRNIVTSALAIARAQGKDRLERNHIKLMLNNVKDFKDEFIRQFEQYKTTQGIARGV